MIPRDLILTSIFYAGPHRKPFENPDTPHQLDNPDPHSSRQIQEIPTSWLSMTFFQQIHVVIHVLILIRLYFRTCSKILSLISDSRTLHTCEVKLTGLSLHGDDFSFDCS